MHTDLHCELYICGIIDCQLKLAGLGLKSPRAKISPAQATSLFRGRLGDGAEMQSIYAPQCKDSGEQSTSSTKCFLK